MYNLITYKHLKNKNKYGTIFFKQYYLLGIKIPFAHKKGLTVYTMANLSINSKSKENNMPIINNNKTDEVVENIKKSDIIKLTKENFNEITYEKRNSKKII